MSKKQDMLLTLAIERITELQDENEKLRERIVELESEIKKLEDRYFRLLKVNEEEER